MKKVVAIAGTFVLGVGLLAALSAFWLPGAAAQEAGGQIDVVMLRCATGSDFAIKAFRGSTNAPTKKTNSCPENVALLIQQGFSIESVGYFDDGDNFIAYTLIRTANP